MILIVTNREDGHADIVIRRLRTLNAKFFRLNTDYASNYSISIQGNAGFLRNNMTGLSVQLSAIKSVWLRRRSVLKLPQLDAKFRSFVESEWSHFFRNLWPQFDNVLWMNHPEAIERGRNKMFQLKLAKEIGFSVPDTIYSNSVREIMVFQKQHGCCIYKPHDGWSFSGNKKHAVFTSVIREPLTLKMAEELSTCPGIFQPNIPKQFELRITVVGDEVFATKIDSQANKQAETDWRKEDFKNLRHEEYMLSSSVCKKCLRLVRKMNLSFAAIDAIVTPKNHLVFLEINCNGQWAWIEAMTRQPISMSIAKNLILGKKQ